MKKKPGAFGSQVIGFWSVIIFGLFVQLGWLSQPWGGDDRVWLQHVRPLYLSDVAAYFDPEWGWYYRPLFLIYFGAVRRMFDDNATLAIGLNLLQHLFALALLMCLAARLGIKRPWLVGALWVLLSLDNQAVGWVSCVTILWVLNAYLAAILCWFSFAETGRRRYYFAAFFLCILGLLSKEEAVTLPLAILVLDFWKRPSLSWRVRALQGLPFAFAVSVYGVLALIAHRHAWIFTNKIDPDPRALLVVLQGALEMFGKWNVLIGTASFIWLGVLAWKQVVTRVCWLWFIVSALPIPMAVGLYAVPSRFWYLTSALGALLIVAMLDWLTSLKRTKLDQGKGLRAVAVAFASVLCVPISRFLLTQTDSQLPQLVCGMLCLVIALAAWRSGWIDGFSVMLLFAVSAGFWLDQRLIAGNVLWANWVGVLAVLASTLIAPLAGWRPWQGFFASTFLLTAAPFTVPLFLAGRLTWEAGSKQTTE